jgi:hypothetical protein
MDGLGGNAVRMDGIFVRMYTTKTPIKHPRIQPFTPTPPRQNVTYLFIGNYLRGTSGHPLATLVVTQSVAGNKNHQKGEDSNER